MTEWEYNTRPGAPLFRPYGRILPYFLPSGDDKTINALDAASALIISAKGLVEELKERDRVIEELRSKNASFAAKAADVEELKARLEALEQRLNFLPPAP